MLHSYRYGYKAAKRNVYKKIGSAFVDGVCKKRIVGRFYSEGKEKGFREQYLSFDKESNNPRVQNVGRLGLSDVFKEGEENEAMKNNWVSEMAKLNDIDKEIALDTIYVDYLDGRIQVDEELMKNWDKISLEEKEMRAIEMMKAYTPLQGRPAKVTSETLPWDEEDLLPGEETENSVGLEDTADYLKQHDKFFQNWDENEGSYEQKIEFLNKMKDVPKNIIEKMNEDGTLVDEHIRASSLDQSSDRLTRETIENPSSNFLEYEAMIQDGTDKEFMQELMDLVDPDDDLDLEDLELDDRLSNQENQEEYDDDDVEDEDAYYIDADNTSISMDKFSFTWDVRDVNFKLKTFDLLPKSYLTSYFSRFTPELFGKIFLEEMDKSTIEDFLLKKLSHCKTFFTSMPREQLEHYMALVPANVAQDLRFIDLREDFQDFLNELNVKVADHILKEMPKNEIVDNLSTMSITDLLPLLRGIDQVTMEKGYLESYPLIENMQDLRDFASVIKNAPIEKARILLTRLSEENLTSVLNTLDSEIVNQLYPEEEATEEGVYDFDVTQPENMKILKEVIYMATNCHLSQKGQEFILNSRSGAEISNLDQQTDSMLEPAAGGAEIDEEDMTSLLEGVVLDAEEEKKLERLYAQVDFAYLELETNVDAVKEQLSQLADELYEKEPTVQTQSIFEMEDITPEAVIEESSPLDKMMTLKKEKSLKVESMKKSKELNLGQLEDVTGGQIREYVESMSPTGVHFANIDIQNPFVSSQADTLLKNDIEYIDKKVNQKWGFENSATDVKVSEQEMKLLKEIPLKEDGTVDTKALMSNKSLLKRIIESEIAIDNSLKKTIVGNVKSILGPDVSDKLVPTAEEAQSMNVETFLKQKLDEGVINEDLFVSLSGSQNFFDASQVENLIEKINEKPSLKETILNTDAPLKDLTAATSEEAKLDLMIKTVKQKILDLSYEDPKHIKKSLNLANTIKEEVPAAESNAQLTSENEETEFVEKDATNTADMTPGLEMGDSFQEFDDESPVLERKEKPKISDFDNSWDYLNALGIFDTEIMSIEDKQLDGIREIQNARSRLQKKRDFADQFMKQYPLYGEEMDNLALGMNKAPKCGAGACIFCSGENNNYPLEPMNVPLLLRFMNRYGFIKPKRITGLCSKMQRRVTKTIAQARNMGLFSYKYNRFEVLNPMVERDTPLYVDEEIAYRVKELMNYKEDAKEIKRYLRWSTKPIVEKGITQKF